MSSPARSSNAAPKVEAVSAALVVKNPKPTVLLLDIQNTVASKLSAYGFNITEGTMGRPYRVSQKSKYEPLIGIAKADNLGEQEIVIVDLEIKSYLPDSEGKRHRPNGETDLFGKCDKGFLDPRVRAAVTWQKDFDRIHLNGGAFIIFSDKRTAVDLITGCLSDYNELYSTRGFSGDVWSLLSKLSDINVESDSGREMSASDLESPLTSLLKKYLPESKFTCSFDGWIVRNWDVLAINKFGNAVALAQCLGAKGTIIILPQLNDKEGFLCEMMTAVLPEICPHLFPFVEKGKWTHRSEYELSLVTTFLSQQEQIRQSAASDIAALDAQIEQERQTSGWMHDLLTGTDAVLVEAVKKALRVLGFEKVVDVDEIQDQAGKPRREDLQIQDESPTLIVDIKGLGGFPADSDANQSFKHATLRIKEWKRFDVQALTLINHQRHLPPLDRDNDMPFRQELLDIANEHEMGLMTTWDLYRLVCGTKRWGWKPQYTKPVLYQRGRICPVPAHYLLLGAIAHVYDKAGVVSIQIDAIGLRKGDRIAFELEIDFEEQEVTTLEVDKVDVETADMGTRAGTKTHMTRSSLKEQARVFLVRAEATA